MGLGQDTESGGFGNRRSLLRLETTIDLKVRKEHPCRDEIQILTPEGISGYFVTTIEIVDPSGPRVLEAPGHSQLTIVTTHSSPPGSAEP